MLLIAAVAAAQPPETCRDDVHKFCHGIQPGAGRIVACLRSHEKELSPACQKDLKSVTPRPGNPRHAKLEACGDDLKKFCKEIAKAKGAGVACLRKHQAELSAPCKSALAP